MQTQLDSPHGHDTSTSMQLSSRARCTATSVVCRFFLQRLFCTNSRRACASPCPSAHILPGCTACKYVLRAFGQGSSYGKCCTGSGIYVLPLRWCLLIRVSPWKVMAITSLPGNPMRRPQQLQVIIIHWTCGHVYGDTLST